jgi:hypothetical protein
MEPEGSAGRSVRDKQQATLKRIIEWATKTRELLTPLIDAHVGSVHFRPSSTGVAMVGLAPDRPQRGYRSANLSRLIRDFDLLFAEHCRDVPQGRLTPEKALQSFLIRDAYEHGRRMSALADAARAAGRRADFTFVTDELALPLARGKIVCDVLALRRDSGRSTPVLIELKTVRDLKRITAQLEYGSLMNEHAELFATSYSAMLGEKVVFDGPVEKWIIWPRPKRTTDRRTAELAASGIQVFGYSEHEGSYDFRVDMLPG